MAVYTLNDEIAFSARVWRAKQTKDHAELLAAVKTHLPDFDDLLGGVEAARKAARDDYYRSLSHEDKKIFSLFEDNWLSGVSKVKQEVYTIEHSPRWKVIEARYDALKTKHAENTAMLKRIKQSRETALAKEVEGFFPKQRAHYGELLEARKPLELAARKLSGEFVDKVLDAKKAVYATPEGKLLIIDAMNAQLADHNQKWGGWFSGALKDADSIEKIALSHPASWDSVVRALQGRGDNHSLNTLVRQAEEIAHFEGKAVSKILPARLKMVGLTDFQVDFFTKTVKAYEAGTHKQFFDDLWKTHKDAIDELLATRRAALDEAVPPRGEAGSVDDGKGAKGAASAGDDFGSGAKRSAEAAEEGWLSKVGKHKYKIGGAVAALAVGGWALMGANKKAEAEAKPKQL